MEPLKTKCECDFCEEIHGNSNSIFYDIYNSCGITSRIIEENDSFVVMPTIGQLFKYSLLVLPKKHIECMAQLSNKEIFDLELLIQKTKIKLSEFGNVIVFEHGAHKETGGSCGIYHAHIHIVPVPSELDLSDFFYTESVVKKYDSLIECYSDLRGSSQYLMALNPDGSIYATDTSNIIHQYPSQFFRKKLVEYYNLDKPWNWREYLKVEKNVLQTIDEVHS